VTLMLWLASAQGTPRYPAKRKAQRVYGRRGLSPADGRLAF
jgi:hypothetical protein